MDRKQLQSRLAEKGCYSGPIDGICGPDTKAGIMKFLTDGPDTALSLADLQKAADELHCPLSHVRAIYEVESSGDPFIDGRPTILPEPHIFSRLTHRMYDVSHPHISSRLWNPKLYRGSQGGRYQHLVEMICLNPLAGFGSASYGGLQILGCNAERCGVRDSMQFAWEEAQSVANQLQHFVMFIKTDQILWRALQKGDWVAVAKRYNGTAYYKNKYDVKLAKAVRNYS